MAIIRCDNCGKEKEKYSFCSDRCRVAFHRKQKLFKITKIGEKEIEVNKVGTTIKIADDTWSDTKKSGYHPVSYVGKWRKDE
jgi:hypothetical protein